VHDDEDDDERIFRKLRRAGQPSMAVGLPTKAKTSAKTRSRQEAFVKVPIWWATAAAKATRRPGFLVCVELLHRAWKARSTPFVLPNGRLEKSGSSREMKRRVLRDLEAAGLIVVERRHGKSPRVTLVGL
jgi:hypothetical protein